MSNPTTTVHTPRLTGIECCPPSHQGKKNDGEPLQYPHWTIPAALAVFGGFNNGYNMIVVAEILEKLRRDKILTTAVQEGIFVASINVGIVLMLPLGAYLADKYGRLRTVIVGEIIVVVASLLQMFCFSALSLTLSRTCVGFGMALCVLLKPLYIAELADPNHRGKLITLFSVAFMSGVLVVALLATTMQNNQGNWRLLLGIGAVPSLLLILAAQFYLVESPVWLRMVEQRSNASAPTGGDGDDDDEARSLTTGALVANNDRHTPGKCSQVFCELFSTAATRNGVGGTTWIAFLSAMLYESDGMWMLVQYRNDVFKETVGQANVHLFAMLLCTVGLVANIVPILLVDRVGRRVLIMVGVTGSVLFKLIFAVVVGAKVVGWPVGLLLLLWAGFAQMGIMTVCNIVISELFGPRHRSVGMCFIYWCMLMVGVLLNFAYRPVALIIGHQGWACIFAACSVVTSVPLLMSLPETMRTKIIDV